MVTVKPHKRVYRKHGTIAHVGRHERHLSPVRGFKSLDKYIKVKSPNLGNDILLTNRELMIGMRRAKKLEEVK